MRYIGGSIQNRIAEGGGQPQPMVGMGATRMSWSDRAPYTVVEVRSPSTIVVQADDYKRIDQNGMSESQKYEYAPDPNGAREVVTRRRNGSWVAQGELMRNGTAYAIGYRDCYHDYSF